MAVLEQEIRSAAALTRTGLQRHLFSREDYHALANAGILDNQRVELIEGELIDMAPIGDAHSALTDPLAMLLRSAFGNGFTVRTQVPILLGDDQRPSEPQPDIAVVVGAWRDYVSRKPQPKDVVLVVEVADSSLDFDRTAKSALYATAGIPEYWIVNLVNSCVDVYRDPANGSYQSIAAYKPGDQIAPLHAPGSFVPVSDCLP